MGHVDEEEEETNETVLSAAGRVGALARAIFGQALADLVVGRDVEKSQAMAWLESRDPDIVEWRAELAGLGDVSEDAIRKVARSGNTELIRLAARRLGSR